MLMLLVLRLWFLPRRVSFLLEGAFVVLLFTCTVTTKSAASDPEDDQGSLSSSAAVLTCPVGFGGDPTLHVVTVSQVNDGYCDCPTTGQDEPLTNACAGREFWAGLGIFDVTNEQPKEITFSCPQQPLKSLSLSKVNDGICDCCCGTDEPSGYCDDVCDEVLAQERAERQRLQINYQQGAEKRNQAVATLEARRQEVSQQLEEKQRTIVTQVDSNLARAVEEVEKWKIEYLWFRKNQLESRVNKVALVLFHPLSTQELFWWIIHACQLAGEMAGNANEGKINTCLPLRLAALDHGILWQHDSYKLMRANPPPDTTIDNSATMTQEERDAIQQAADLLLSNMKNIDKGKDSFLVYNELGLKQLNEKIANERAKAVRANNRRKRKKQQAEEYDDDGLNAYSEDEDEEENDDYGYDDDAVIDSGSGRSYKQKDNSEEDEFSADSEDESKPADSSESKNKSSNKSVSKKALREVRSRRISQSRNSFLEESGKLLKRMNDILEDIKKKEDEERRLKAEQRRKELDEKRKKKEADNAEGEIDDDTLDSESLTAEEVVVSVDGSSATTTKVESDPATNPSFDPVALPMVRNKLSSLKSRVQKGVHYAVSAKMLLDILMESHGYALQEVGGGGDKEAQVRADLYRLAVGTIAHGKLSSIHVWHLYHYVVEELAALRDTAAAAADVETCQSPWASACPPVTVERQVAEKVATIPQGPILKAAEEFCAQQAEIAASGAAASTCTAALALKEDQIPSDIPDGFMGYYAINPREEKDTINEALDVFTLRLSDENRKALDELAAEERKLRSEKKKIQKEMKDLRDSVGFDDADKYGLDGELFALKDQCFSYEAGKYVYEACLFGSAKQKEGKASGGTDLGKWTEPSVDEVTGQRLWQWSNGLRCWQGPSRSTTAYVTCGAETRILSVEEPEICKYELQMESYVACDETFRREKGL